MLEFDSPFHRRVAQLKAPTSAQFDASAWKPLLDDAPSASDMSLLATAMLLAAEAQAFRQLPADAERTALDAVTESRLCVAAMNIEYSTTLMLSAEASRQAVAAGALSYGHVTGAQFETGRGQKIDALTTVDTTVDSCESWLYDILQPKSATLTASAPEQMQDLAARTIRHYSVQYGLNVIWKQCLYGGWRAVPKGNAWIWGPTDPGAERLLEATRIRHSENFLNFPHIDQLSWTAMSRDRRRAFALPRTVLEATSGKRWRVKLGRSSCLSKTAPPYVIERAGLEGCYLNFFLDMPLPSMPGFTCRGLLKAWHVILDLALLLAKESRSIETLTVADARRISLEVSGDELCRIIGDCLQIKKDEARTIVDFFVFRPKVAGQKGTRGLWAAPLVPIPGHDSYALALPVLAMSHPLRKVELWLEKGGLDDRTLKKHRGDVYESHCRASMRAAIARNEVFSNVRCAEHAIKKSSDFGEQIDLLIRLGDLLLVAEVKCWLFPADPYEKFQYFRNLKKAADQASRKAAAIKARPDVAAKALELEKAEVGGLRTVPIIVTNQGFAFSVEVGGCRVVDAAFLETYLATGTVLAGVTVGGDDIGHLQHKQYATEQQAADHFEATIAKPAMLYRFLGRIKASLMPFPSLIDAKNLVTVYNLADIEGDERVATRMMAPE